MADFEEEHDLNQRVLPPEPPVLPRRAAAERILVHPLHHVKAPQKYRKGNNLNLYLTRFDTYADSLNATQPERVQMLLALLDDATLGQVQRFLGPELTYPELIRALRQESEWDSPNRMRFISELRSRRQRNEETVREFFHSLYTLVKKAYPENDDAADMALRENFVYNLNDSYISSRLREHPQYDSEQLVDLASTLESCKWKDHADKRKTGVNAVGDLEVVHQQITGRSNDEKGKKKDKPSMPEMMSQLVSMMERMETKSSERDTTTQERLESIYGINQSDARPAYEYHGPKVSLGLQDYSPQGEYANGGNGNWTETARDYNRERCYERGNNRNSEPQRSQSNQFYSSRGRQNLNNRNPSLSYNQRNTYQ